MAGWSTRSAECGSAYMCTYGPRTKLPSPRDHHYVDASTTQVLSFQCNERGAATGLNSSRPGFPQFLRGRDQIPCFDPSLRIVMF